MLEDYWNRRLYVRIVVRQFADKDYQYSVWSVIEILRGTKPKRGLCVNVSALGSLG